MTVKHTLSHCAPYVLLVLILIFQFSLGNLYIINDLSNIQKTNQLYSIEDEDCGEGCRLIKFWKFRIKCWCPTKPKTQIFNN